MKKVNIIIILLSFFMFSGPVRGQVTAEQFYEQSFQKPARAATDHEVWVWCNVCHQYVPEVNGVLYDWNPTTSAIGAKHPHQNGFTTEDRVPIGDTETLISIVIIFVATVTSITLIKKI